MDVARFLGIMIVFGAPAIIGGGLIFHLLHSWVAVWIFEILLVGFAFRTACNAACKSSPDDHGHGAH